jgi:hypothetical protein
MDIERNVKKKTVKIKSGWVTVFILVATLVLIVAQAWNIFYGEEPEQINLAQASSNEDLAGLTDGDASSSADEGPGDLGNYVITITGTELDENNLQVLFSHENYDPLEGKIYPGFYFDEFSSIEDSYLYYGESPAELSLELLPIDAEQVCASLFTANLERLKETETCLAL